MRWICFFFHKILAFLSIFILIFPWKGERGKCTVFWRVSAFTKNHGRPFKGRGIILHNFYLSSFSQGKKERTLQAYEKLDLRILLNIYLLDKSFCISTELCPLTHSYLPSLAHSLIYCITVEWGLQGTDNA